MGKDKAVPFLLEDKLKECGGDYIVGPDWHPHAGALGLGLVWWVGLLQARGAGPGAGAQAPFRLAAAFHCLPSHPHPTPPSITQWLTAS